MTCTPATKQIVEDNRICIKWGRILTVLADSRDLVAAAHSTQVPFAVDSCVLIYSTTARASRLLKVPDAGLCLLSLSCIQAWTCSKSINSSGWLPFSTGKIPAIFDMEGIALIREGRAYHDVGSVEAARRISPSSLPDQAYTHARKYAFIVLGKPKSDGLASV